MMNSFDQVINEVDCASSTYKYDKPSPDEVADSVTQDLLYN